MSKTRASWLQDASSALQTVSDTAHLDAELLLCRVLQRTRTHLKAYADEMLSASELQAVTPLLKLRLEHMPMAYLLGRQSFWSFELDVTPEVLIPRPETELLVETALHWLKECAPSRVADWGTGSGAVVLSLALEAPHHHYMASDIALPSLAVAQRNAKRLGVHEAIEWVCADWGEGLPDGSLDMIVSNPPYIESSDVVLKASSLRHEPQRALDGGEDGLSAYRALLKDAHRVLSPPGRVMLEHGAAQRNQLAALFAEYGFEVLEMREDWQGKDRVMVGGKQ